METVLLIGIPAAGKSTFCKRFSDTHVRVNLDTLRTRKREERLVEKCLAERQAFVVDNTNLFTYDRARYIPLAKASGYRVVGYVFKCSIGDALKRNARREGRACVPDFVIHRMQSRFEPPDTDEGFDALFDVAVEPGVFKVTEAGIVQSADM